MRVHFDEVRNNKIKSIVLIFSFIIIIGVLGAVVGFVYDSFIFGISLSLITALIYTLIVFKSGNKMILSMTGARPVLKKDYPHLFHTVEGLAVAAGIPAPKSYVIKDTALNAFATGKDPEHAAIVVTTGLLDKLNRQELEGVVAHEMSHVKNYDIRFMMLTTVLVGVVTLISDFILRSFLWGRIRRRNNGNGTIIIIVIGLALAILTPIIGQMIRFAISRKREYMADANAAILTRYPVGLANALKKIKADPDPLVDKANKATAHLFISTPFRKKKSFVTKMFATHPPIEERIKRLQEM
ncbi:MAG: M48 family metallopeptidase [Nanoarchaeota archaeon]|nr:M48 family metallopeptidase [Nanoarchaeota archaeon]